MLQNKRIFITGSTRGIGAAIAKACAARGAVVGINGRVDSDSSRTVAEELGPGKAVFCPFDVSDPEAVEAGIEDFVDKAGGLDGLVNNAGIHRSGVMALQAVEDIEDMLKVNLLGPVLCARAALSHFFKARAGVILNIGSIAARKPGRGGTVYAATKGGVEALTRGLAQEVGRKGIRVVGISPGPVDTAMMGGAKSLGEREVLARLPLGRLGRPGDVGALAAFLMSEDASFVTGCMVDVDGGYGIA